MNLHSFNIAIESVCEVTHATKDELLGEATPSSCKLAKKLAFYALRVVFNWSYAEIASAFGYAHHATASRACNEIFNRKPNDQYLTNMVNEILELCKTKKVA